MSPAPGHLAAVRLPFTDHKANDLGVMSASNPEARAREQIDAILTAAGWVVQDRADFNPAASAGVAVREFPLKTRFADYLLLQDVLAAEIVEDLATALEQFRELVADLEERYPVDSLSGH